MILPVPLRCLNQCERKLIDSSLIKSLDDPMKPKAKRDIYRVGRWLLPSIWVVGTFFSGLVIDKLIPAQGLTFQWQKGLILLTSMSLLGAVVLGTGLLIERWRIHRHPYEFDRLSGTYIDRQNPSLRFCTKCLGPPDWLATHVTEKPDSYVCRRCSKVYMKEHEQPPNP